MKKIIFISSAILLMAACNTKTNSDTGISAVKDTLSYAFKATYSSDITVPANPVNAQKVLQVWKMFESMDINAMKPYFADTIMYDDASGMHFYGSAEQLLTFAKKDVDGLDSMRFDISMWQSAHINDKDEDWVNIWSTERRYPKNGKADTVLMQENWQVKNGKVVHFNQYLAKK
jgi:hypothetical protein